jgi:hypothetical protein
VLIKLLFPFFRLALWAADSGDPGGEADDTPPAGEAGDTDPPTGGDKPGDDRRFTQAEVDRFTGKARREALARWAKENGFADVKDLEAVIAAKRDADDKAKSDLDKANERATRESERADAAEKRLYDIVLKFGFQLAASEQVADIDLAYLAAQDLGLLNGDGPVEIDLETATVKGMDKVVEKLLKQKPILKKSQGAAPAGTGGSAGGVTLPPGQLTPEQEAAYKARFGIR